MKSMEKEKRVVVIGGGLGGLSAAITLKQYGFQVTLIEKNSHLGGKVNWHEQDGFTFDLGPSLLTMPEIFEELFVNSDKKMGDYIDIESIDLQWRSFFEDGTVIDLYPDLSRMEETNQSLSPKDIRDIQNFLNYAKKLDYNTKQGYFKEGLDNLPQLIRHHGIKESLTGFDYFNTMQQGIDKRIENSKLRDMFGYFIKYVGSSAYDAPAILNMMAYMQFDQGVWYVRGGLQNLAKGIAKLAEDIGVELITARSVEQVTTSSDGLAEYVITEDGTEYKADYVVSNMEVLPFYKNVLDKRPKNIRKLEDKFPPSASGLVLHLGVKRHYPNMGHHNFFFSQDSRKNYHEVFHQNVLPEDPTIYVVNSTRTDLSQAPGDSDNLKVLPHIPNLKHVNFTADEYQTFKNRVLDKLERMGLDNLRNEIVSEYMLTPDDIKTLYNSDAGSIYGTLSDRKVNNGFKHPKQSEYIPNLYFAGGTVNPGGGMPMVTLSGQQTGKMIARNEGRV